MRIEICEGLPLVSVSLFYNGKTLCLNDVLLDTGCSATIFDADEVEGIGLVIDRTSGRPRRMYGVGGESELCYEQIVSNIKINNRLFGFFKLQLGITKETYGFNGILGMDFLIESGSIINFKEMVVR